MQACKCILRGAMVSGTLQAVQWSFCKNCQHSWDAFVVPINMHVTWLQRHGVEFKVH